MIDSLHPYSSDIRMKLLPEEKKRFPRHLFRYWEIIRSRIPPDSGAIIDRLLGTGQLKIHHGRITGIDLRPGMLEIKYLDHGARLEKSETAQHVINRMGPSLD